MKKRFWLKSSVLALVATYGLWVANASAEEVAVQILGVNDFHGALDTTGNAYLPDEAGGKVSGAGTAALLATYLDDAETEFKETNQDKHSESIRVQAGDMVGASPANSGLLQDEPTVKVFNEMNFEYGTLGNHEFDEGLAEYDRIIEGKAPTPGEFYPIVDEYNHEPAKQEIVIANVRDKATGDIPFGWKPYAIKTITTPSNEQVQIGFIGVVTQEIPNLVLRKNHEQYDITDEAEAIAKYAKELRDQSVYAIVVLAHVPSTSKDGQAFGEAKKMIEKLNDLDKDNSVDIVFAGHNHVYTNGLADADTLIVQATSQGKAYADVRGILDTETKDFVKVPTATINAVKPTADKQPKASIQAIVAEANRIVKTVTDAKISTAESGENITRDLNEAKESPVGNLITTGQLEIARKSGYTVDFAMTNNGGIRADLLVQPDGTITWGAAQAVQPFGNILQIVQMTGEQIFKVLNQQYDEEERYFLQISGLKYTYTEADNPTKENPFQVVEVTDELGNQLDPNKLYTVVINDFLYGGGDGFSEFRNAKLIGAINPDTEVFVEYLTNLEKLGKKVSGAVGNRKKFVPKSEINHKPILSPSLQEEQGAPAGTNRPEALTNKRILADVEKEAAALATLEGKEPNRRADQAMPVAMKSTTTVAVPSEKALPKTGDGATASFLTVLGLTSLFGAIRIKKNAKN
ncbi:LPXTG cell wall anchor domain-containing protein [Streptococcus sp. zg-86]|uniref:LPXTG cell wall anchor domain-containing protein n=1 Tax=Streptococcus zhangguiae TaxID=2664091 RepID=A0A6I4RFK1_9STRE|nr:MULTISPECIES: bifunctional metallophosphatase/5'-nucleotidase [unclassified Streptococcus]MTB64626.1 LPXTG cell wall anchor domain-containing protein [Streptococcus sp. zg-86]MTB90936.1 LPXTG cell wall anchor domain-containing protein [Streptococcus sp. zg-36]MWV56640.1 LPXTG cell wall anchor domain-containing protein [Streptococcus sp. zg-70]QTH48599.1 bifunctional metallophosphatase/5'-nucleotidase [Streptococcus sp. zg-86]